MISRFSRFTTGAVSLKNRLALSPTMGCPRYCDLRNMKLPLVLFQLLMFAGCGTQSASEFRAPDGSTLKSVKCASDSSRCFATAAQSCPGGGTYRVVSSDSHAGGAIADIIPGPVTWYSMTYACGLSDGRMPDFNFVGQRYTPSPAPAPRPIIVTPAPAATTTNCIKVGDTVSCSTY